MGKILLVGANGMLGTEFRELLDRDGFYAPSSSEMDIRNIDAIRSYCASRKDIHTIINCAARNDTEVLEDNQEAAYETNVLAPCNLANVANECGAKLVHFSTDYVFDGKKSTPYTETDPTDPLCVYAKSKCEGEEKVLWITNTCVSFRIAWLFSPYRKNFVKTILTLAKTKDHLDVVGDHIGSPSYAKDVATAVLAALPKIQQGTKEIYHLTNDGACSWYDLAHAAVQKAGISCDVRPILSKDYPTKARRPSYSVLDKSKFKSTFGLTLRHWQDGLDDCITRMKASGQL